MSFHLNIRFDISKVYKIFIFAFLKNGKAGVLGATMRQENKVLDKIGPSEVKTI